MNNTIDQYLHNIMQLGLHIRTTYLPFYKNVRSLCSYGRKQIVIKRFQNETYKHIVEKYKKEELIGFHIGGKLNMHITILPQYCFTIFIEFDNISNIDITSYSVKLQTNILFTSILSYASGVSFLIQNFTGTNCLPIRTCKRTITLLCQL